MKFTDKFISHLQAKEKDFRVREGHGFAIRVLPSSVKRFEFIYSWAGKRRILHLGNYPSVSLAEARAKFNEATLQLAKGLDPRKPPPPPKPEAELITVHRLANEWLEWSRDNHSMRWANTLKLALAKDVLPIHGHKLASELRRRDAIQILGEKAKNAPGQARNLHKALRGMYQYGVENELVEFNPFAEVRTARSIPAMKETPRKRVLSDDEIKFIWTAIEHGGGSDSTQRALKIMLLTGQRNGEVCGMHSNEIEFGLGKPQCQQCRRCGWWVIPESRRQGNKGGEHRIFLSVLAMQIIGDHKGYIFPGDTIEKPITANAVNYHVRREVDSTGKKPYYGLERWTPHDLRRTCGTGVRRLGATRDTMDLILGHTTGGVTGVYDQYEGDAEKQRWLTAWGEFLAELVQR